MMRTRRPNRQLELPMLSDINGKSQFAQKRTNSTHRDMTTTSESALLSATPQELSVYEEISANYFQSLKKA